MNPTGFDKPKPSMGRIIRYLCEGGQSAGAYIRLGRYTRYKEVPHTDGRRKVSENQHGSPASYYRTQTLTCTHYDCGGFI